MKLKKNPRINRNVVQKKWKTLSIDTTATLTFLTLTFKVPLNSFRSRKDLS